MTTGFLAHFLSRASQDPDRLLVTIYKNKEPISLTYAGVSRLAETYAALLRERGALPGDVTLISLPTSPDLFAAFLGALLIGCVPSFMPLPSIKQDAALFWATHAALFSHIGNAFLVTSLENRTDIESHIPSGLRGIITSHEARNSKGVPLTEVYDWQPNEIACLQHSSGTTGLKKGVALSFAKIALQIEIYAKAIALSEADTIVSWLPLYHDMGFIACFLMPLTIGNPLIMLDPFEWLADPLFLFELIDKHDGRYAWMPNFAFNHLVNVAFDDDRKVDLSRLRALINCSEPCKPDTFRSFASRFASWGLSQNSLQICYALAEAVFAVSQTRMGESSIQVSLPVPHRGLAVGTAEFDPADKILSVGRPLPTVEIAVFNESCEAVGDEAIGQIGLRGPYIIDGYYRDEERTKKVFHEGFYLTGDLGFVRAGELFILGRLDDLIITLGKNIFAHDVEAIVGSVKGTKPGRAIAFGLYNATIGSEEIIIVAEKDAALTDELGIRNGIRSRLAAILGVVPKAILIVDAGWLIKSTSGKISRHENRLKYISELRQRPRSSPRKATVQ
jgi:acyl-CoA synthetase (AMP-forming)/AMP-acid ligase II